MIHWPEIEHHIESDGRRLCDGEPASESDVYSLNQNGIRQSRGDATLCPDYQDRSSLHDFVLRPYIWGPGPLSCAHHYTVPVRHAFDAIRNCAHCRRSTDDDCPAWRNARKCVDVLSKEARRLVRDVLELQDVTGGSRHNLLIRGRFGRLLRTGRTLLVGDAASVLDPLTGEGIYGALWTGKVAAASVGGIS